MRILHVTEAFGAGTAGAIKQYVASLPQHEHFLAFSERDEAPIDDSTLDIFTAVRRLPKGHLNRIRAIRALTAGRPFDVVHAHSSFAGMYVRVARLRTSTPIVYTPHCLAFERRDISTLVRTSIWLVESALAVNTSVFAGCSPYETNVSAHFIGSSKARTVYVPNVSSGTSLEPQAYPSSEETVRLIGIGRIAPQKDPSFFAATYAELRQREPRLSAIWIGDGSPELRRELEVAGVEVTGWLSFAEARAAYNRGPSIYLHTARWEGFPLSILEAAVSGVPSVIRDLPLYEGIDIPSPVTSPIDAANEVTKLLNDEATWERRISDLRLALLDNQPDVQSERLEHAYELAMKTR